MLRGMWDLPRPGLEPVCPALAGRLPTTVPPGKPRNPNLVAGERPRERVYGGKRGVAGTKEERR